MLIIHFIRRHFIPSNHVACHHSSTITHNVYTRMRFECPAMGLARVLYTVIFEFVNKDNQSINIVANAFHSTENAKMW